MTTQYSGNAANFPATVSLPADAIDLITALSFAQGLEDLADRTAYLAQSIGNPLTNWMGPIALPAGVGVVVGGFARPSPQRLIAYSPKQGTQKSAAYVAVGGTDKAAYSLDLRNWTASTPGAAGTNLSLVATDGVGTFVAGGPNKNTLYRVTASGNAFAAWSAPVLPGGVASDGPDDLIWNPSLSLFVAVTENNRLATSPDGVTWTARTSAYNPGSGFSARIAMSSAGLMLITYPGGGTASAQKSTDGITWTLATLPAVNNWRAAYMSALSLWVLMSDDGKVYTSPDATNWTLKYTTPAGSGALGALQPECIGPFIAATAVTGVVGPVNGAILFSSDSGATWRHELMFGGAANSTGVPITQSIQRIGNRLAVTTGTNNASPGQLYVSGAVGASDLVDL